MISTSGVSLAYGKQKLFTDVEQGCASEQDRQLATRLSISYQLSSALLEIDPHQIRMGGRDPGTLIDRSANDGE